MATPRAHADAEFATHLAREAGKRLREFRRNFSSEESDRRAAARRLRDAADAASQAFLDRELRSARPHDAVLSEEAEDAAERDHANHVWIIDPLDGTWEYGLGRDDWAVHVALWDRGVPTAERLALGVVAVPDADEVFISHAPPELPPLDVSRPVRIVTSRSRPPATLDQVAAALVDRWVELGGPAHADIVRVGSVGAKVARLLTGHVEVYLHDTGFFEWDVAAPLAVAQAAGLQASHLDGAPVTFNHRPPKVSDLLVCRPELATSALSALATTAQRRPTADQGRMA